MPNVAIQVSSAVLDLIQDTFILLVLSILFGRLIERLFFPEGGNIYPIRQRGTLTLAILVYAQLLIDVIAVYIIRRIVRRFPSISGRKSSREMTDVEMSLVISVVFIACQPSLILRINELIRRF